MTAAAIALKKGIKKRAEELKREAEQSKYAKTHEIDTSELNEALGKAADALNSVLKPSGETMGDSKKQFSESANFAKAAGVSNNKILKNKNDIDKYFRDEYDIVIDQNGERKKVRRSDIKDSILDERQLDDNTRCTPDSYIEKIKSAQKEFDDALFKDVEVDPEKDRDPNLKFANTNVFRAMNRKMDESNKKTKVLMNEAISKVSGKCNRATVMHYISSNI